MRTLVIIPAYNEAANIARVVDELRCAQPQLDFLVINDGSGDATLSILQERHIPHLNLSINLGIGGVIQTGYLFALSHGYEIAVQLDGDGQHDPQQIGALLQPLLEGSADLVIGSRFLESEGYLSTTLRRFGIQFISGVIRLCAGVRIRDVTSGFRAVNRKLMRFYAENYAQDYPEPEAILTAALNGFRIREVPVTMRERQGGVSSINALRSVYYMIKVTLALLLHRLGFSTRRTSS